MPGEPMPGEVTGEVIELYWDGRPDQLFVRGHVKPQEARKALKVIYEDTYKFSNPVPAYGRWSMEEVPWDSEPGHILRVYQERGTGRFPIMVADVT